MRMKGDIRRRKWLRRLFKMHTGLLAITFGLYFTFAFLDPGLLLYDLRQKFRAFVDDTILLTAHRSHLFYYQYFADARYCTKVGQK